MSIPTIEEVQAATAAFQAALTTEQAARDNREAKAEAFLDILARFRGGVTSADLAAVTKQLQAHASRLEDLARPPALPLSRKDSKMAVPQELTDALKKIDDDTTALAGVVKSLRDQITTSMTQPDVDALKSSLDQVATRLEGIAADPNQPVPPGPLPQAPKRKRA